MNNILHITYKQLQGKISCGDDFLLLDVREDFEREHFNIGGIHIPLAEVLNKAAEIPKTTPVIVYCRKGVRSQIAIQKLQDRFEYKNLINLQGGIDFMKY